MHRLHVLPPSQRLSFHSLTRPFNANMVFFFGIKFLSAPQVYVSLNEARNFQHNLAGLLGVPEATATPQQLTASVRQVVQLGLGYDRELLNSLRADYNLPPPPGAPGSTIGGGAPAPVPRNIAAGQGRTPLAAVVLKNGDIVWEHKKGSAEAEAFLDPSVPLPSDGAAGGDENAPPGGAGVGVASAPAAAAAAGLSAGPEDPAGLMRAMSEVLDALHVSDPNEALGQIERLVSRLNKLDEVLPRYQGCVRRLFHLLQVTSLDDLAPAIERLVASQG
jgi:hypothetical protein